MPPELMSDNARGNGGGRNVILFDVSKQQQYTPTVGFKNMHRKLRSAWTVELNTAEIAEETFASQECRVLVIAGPRSKFTQLEFDSIKGFLSSGGSLLVLMGEGGETKSDTNINFLLEEFGIMVNSDSVIRTVFYRYFHPKEALISNGVLNRALAQIAGKVVANSYLEDEENNAQALQFVYPHGATLSVNRRATAVLSTGSVCFPLHRPVCAFHHDQATGGKIAVVGSLLMFTDQYLDREENSKILDVVIKFLTEEVRLNPIDADDPEISDPHVIPDQIQMSNQIKICLQEGEAEMPTRDLSKLFDASLHAMDLSLLPRCTRSFEQLGIKHEPLGLIQPQFEVPQPALDPAVYMPNFRELPHPELELFDLDDMFSSEKVRLAQITNKCEESDLDFFIRTSGEILSVTNSLSADKRTAKHILDFIFGQICEFKKLNQEEHDGFIAGGEQELFEGSENFSDLDDYDM